MKGSGFLLTFWDALKNIKTNSLMSLASIGVLSACLLILGSSILIAGNVSSFVTSMEKQNEVVLFLDDNLSAEQNTQIGEKINNISNIESSTYISKEQALDEYKKEFGDQQDLFVGLDEKNPLRNSYHIKIKDLKEYDTTLYALKSIEGIANVRERQDIVDKLLSIRSSLTMIAIWILVILVAVSLFIISNTVRLAMFTRKLEINIMKFVGATDNFIRLPFLIEGVIIGLISSLVAFFIQWYIYSNVLYPLLKGFDFFAPLGFYSYSFLIFKVFIGFALVIGILGSILPMRKYLRV